jgi:hypothetical protein
MFMFETEAAANLISASCLADECSVTEVRSFTSRAALDAALLSQAVEYRWRRYPPPEPP